MSNNLATVMPFTVEKKTVMNEMQQPIAVQIDYQDWLRIEQLLSVKLMVPAKRQFGSAKGLIQISEDFDAPLEDFKEYM